MTPTQKEIAAALEAALRAMPRAAGVVLLAVHPMAGAADPGEMDVEVASAFRGRELRDGELRDLLKTALGFQEKDMS